MMGGAMYSITKDDLFLALSFCPPLFSYDVGLKIIPGEQVTARVTICCFVPLELRLAGALEKAII
jgi:hypothetical protein